MNTLRLLSTETQLFAEAKAVKFYNKIRFFGTHITTTQSGCFCSNETILRAKKVESPADSLSKAADDSFARVR